MFNSKEINRLESKIEDLCDELRAEGVLPSRHYWIPIPTQGDRLTRLESLVDAILDHLDMREKWVASEPSHYEITPKEKADE